jgi:hypothetical protein
LWYNIYRKNKKEKLKVEVLRMNKAANEALRAQFVELVSKMMADHGEDVLRVKSNEIAIPCVDKDGDDNWVVITVKVPSGSRDGDAYDGYGEAESYEMKVGEKAEKDKENAAKKARKIAADEKRRKQLAEQKANRGEG